MIKHRSHMFIYDEALDFYTKKFGFEVKTHVLIQEPKAKAFRWLTVSNLKDRKV